MFELYYVIARLINAYQGIMVVYILLSWLPGAYDSKFGQLLSKICEPYLSIFRRFIPPLGGIDFSPIIAFFALNLIQRGIAAILLGFS
ncbi:YggT family protein [Carnobacterium gallinarum]|uniref:YggT family protein n=1 Tax=Carnobacterium gallinarum TaxID=2749 RepID=UPI0005557BA2|nr:YggT family protein [Carnobacterium gallinarum]